jgi:hypothetical protein
VWVNSVAGDWTGLPMTHQVSGRDATVVRLARWLALLIDGVLAGVDILVEVGHSWTTTAS